jgi:anti-sigma regulatory factor (Ser/Thr protein kinase)
MPRREAAMLAAKQFFDPKPESVGLARDFATATLAAWGLDGAADDVRLCVSELASNALAHGTTPGHGFLVRLDTDDDFVRLEVHDSRSDDGESGPGVRHPAETDTSGRGLMIVATLADSWGVEDREPFGKVIWSRFNAGPPVRSSSGTDQQFAERSRPRSRTRHTTSNSNR